MQTEKKKIKKIKKIRHIEQTKTQMKISITHFNNLYTTNPII
jgi:hypothetical protein